MKPTDPNSAKLAKLRQDAEAEFAHAPKLRPRPPEVMLHELQVQQIELEMQNEQLRQAQIELEKSRDCYVDFYDFAPVGYLTLNREEMIEEANLTCTTLLGVERSKLLHRRFAHFIAPADRDCFHRHFMTVLEHDNKLDCELAIQRGDGACFHARMDCLRLKKDNRETVVRIVMADITERKQLEMAMREALERYEKITQLVPGVVYQFRLRPNGSTCFPYASDTFRKMFRFNPAETRKDASRVFTLVHPDDLDGLMASIQSSARNLTPWQHEFRVKFEDGTQCWLFGNSLPQRETDGSTLWHGFLTDITARKLAEEALLQKTVDLGERVKEIRCLYEISRITNEPDRTMDDVFEESVRLIPSGWCYPKAACARITFGKQQFATENFMETPWKLSSDIVVSEKSAGKVDVCYLDEMPARDEGPFLKEERTLLDDLAGKFAARAHRAQIQQSLFNYTNELALHNWMLKLIGQDAPLPEILDELARQFEALHPGIQCLIMLADKGEKHLRVGAAPGLPDDRKQALDGVDIGDGDSPCGVGSCCCTRANMEDKQHGCRLGLLADMQFCYSQPIVNTRNRVLGKFIFYSRQSEQPLDAGHYLLESYANLAMLAIDREQARRVLRSEQELKTYKKAARKFSAHLQTMREEEKTGIAREIHDEMGGTLTALKMETYWLAEALSENDEALQFLEHVEQMSKLIDDATNVMRRIITGLRPSILDDLGLAAALEWQADQFQKRTSIECRVNCVEEVHHAEAPDKSRSINLFRIFQEALTNVSRHSGASRVEVEFIRTDEEIMLTISDNGCGKPEKNIGNPASYGILGMTERATQIGGKIKFGNPPGGGFSVTVTLPVKGHQEEETA